ncbi:type IV secretion protein Rhs [Burkholderia sp. Se-20373]|uniref:RHS repeat-associated core domain-containing protein n=1 Tax=Burkholderia sp. Se-20373 TaxID=2703898 RepID=UPI001980CF72|nr:RHS repeat-associated core domain-containing protein [Burkholderia sp. Se-20373]MBN3745418.1 type IV secretion protein Rhs [Burkholderia sp. Se-20373]
MGLPAVKHLDPVVGVDLHSVLVAPSPTPVFLPHPHVGFMLDLREYVNAALGVIGAIAFTIIEEKAVEYLEDHPDDAKKLEDTAHAVSGELQKLAKDPTVAQALKGAKTAGDIANAVGAGVGMGSIAGRPIFVNGMLRATAGTHAFHAPALHFPLGESFAPPDPDPSNDAEAYMGSKTVLANNDPMAFLALPAMSCWAVGLEPPAHNGAHTKREHLSLPTSFMLPIPTGRPVLVGGPPIVNMAALAKGLFKAFRGSEWAKTLADKLHLKPGFLKCKVLHAEPVDTTTGEVVVRQEDFTVAGRLPLTWVRRYISGNTGAGVVGVGWQTPADIRLEWVVYDGATGLIAHFPDHTTAFDSIPDDGGWPARIRDWQYGHALYRCGELLTLRTRTGIEYVYAIPHAPLWPTSGRPVTFLVQHISDPSGNAWEFVRRPEGQPLRIVEWRGDGLTGRRIECCINECIDGNREHRVDRLSSMTLIDTEGRPHPLVNYEYDRDGNLAVAFDALGHDRRFEYIDGHMMTCHTNALGASFRYSYRQQQDGKWRVDHAWGRDGLFDYRFDYDVRLGETRITNSLGHTSIMQINSRGMPVSLIDPLGGVSSYRYDERGRTCAETDPDGHTYRWEYDDDANLLAEYRPDGSATRVTLDKHGRPSTVTLPDGRKWHYEWDAVGNLIAQQTPAQAIYKFEYDRSGQLVSSVGPIDAVSTFSYDQDGNLAEIIDSSGSRVRYEYDARGNTIRVDDETGRSQRYEYDRVGNLKQAWTSGGGEIHCAYDADDNLIGYRDHAGGLFSARYSDIGQIIARTAPDGSVVEYRYDTEGRVIEIVNEKGECYALLRDANGGIVRATDYHGNVRTYEYSLGGRLLATTNGIGGAIAYETDTLGRIVRKRVSDPRQSDAVRVETFEYDRGDNLVSANNPDSHIERRYDDSGRLVEEKQGDDFTIAWTYDVTRAPIERVTRLRIGTEVLVRTIRYAYRASGLLESLQIDDGLPIVLERDANGNVFRERLTANLGREFNWTANGQLTAQRMMHGTRELFSSEYLYDDHGEPSEKHNSWSMAERYEYDAFGHLIGHDDAAGVRRRFKYDPTGNLAMESGPHRVHHEASPFPENLLRSQRVILDGNGWRAFDHAGHVCALTVDRHELTLGWDATSQLINTSSRRQEIDEYGSLHTEATVATCYDYDVFGRRVRKITTTRSAEPLHADASNESVTTTNFFWDGDTLVAEHTVSGAMNREREPAQSNANSNETQFRGTVQEWIYYPGTFRPLTSISRSYDFEHTTGHKGVGTASLSDTTFGWFYLDPNGLPARVIDDNGSVTWEGRFDPWGTENPPAETGHAHQPLRFQGQYYDDETGLHYNRHRYYGPASGNFMCADPIGLRGGNNLYAYAPNPLAWIDPTGLIHYIGITSFGQGATDWLHTEWNSGEAGRKAILDPNRNFGGFIPDSGNPEQYAFNIPKAKNKVGIDVHTEEVIAGGDGVTALPSGLLITERMPCDERCRPNVEQSAVHTVHHLQHRGFFPADKNLERVSIRLMAVFNMDLPSVLKAFRHKNGWSCPDIAP